MKLGITLSKYVPNLNYVLPPYASEDKSVVNTLVEFNRMSLNKYERVLETGQLKLDRVSYATIANPAGAYGEIPGTLALDGDQLDIMILNVTEPLLPGSIAEVRIIGIMKFEDGGEVDDKVIGVLNDDKRSDHITSFDYFGEHIKKEMTYYWEHYKDLKKPGTCKVVGFFDAVEAVKVIDECVTRFETELRPKFQ